MGWRDVAAGVASGAIDYTDKGDPFGDILTGFASVYVPAMTKKAESERTLKIQEEKDRQDNLEEARKEQKAADEKEQKLQKEARSLVVSLGQSPANANAITFARQQLESIGDYGKTLTYLTDVVEKGRLDTNAPANTFYPNRGVLPSTIQTQMDEAFETSMSQASGETRGLPEGGDVRSKIRMSESSNKSAATATTDDGRLHAGLYQFGDARLSDYNRVNKTNYTAKDVAQMSSAEQEKIADWHFSDIDTYISDSGLDKYIGQTINGVVITKSAMVGIAHLGGNSGLKQYLETDGRYNPGDGKTKLSDYAKKFANASDTPTSPEESDRTQSTFSIAAPEQDYATMSDSELQSRIANETNPSRKIKLENALNARTDYATMTDNELKSRLAVEQDPQAQQSMQTALDARLEIAAMSSDELRSRIATTTDSRQRRIMRMALEARENIAGKGTEELRSMAASETDPAKLAALNAAIQARVDLFKMPDAELKSRLAGAAPEVASQIQAILDSRVDYAEQSTDELRSRLASETDLAKKAAITAAIDARTDYASMGDDQLRSLQASETDPKKKAAITAAIEGRTDYASMTDDRLRSLIAAETDPAKKAQMETALTSRTPAFNLSTSLAEADSLGKITALENSVTNTTYEDAAAKEADITAIKKAKDSFIQNTDREASQTRDPVWFIKFATNGSLNLSSAVLVRRTPDGYVYDNGSEEEEIVPPEMLDTGRLLTKDGVSDFAKIYNDDITKMTTFIATGATVLGDYVGYRKEILDNPAALNVYLKAGAAISTEIESISAALTSMIQQDGSYSYGIENTLLNTLQGLTQADRIIAQRQLRLAYSIAAMRGSTGQALSDKELAGVLASLGVGITNPQKLIGVINSGITSEIKFIERKRSIQIQGYMGPEGITDILGNTPFGRPFKETLDAVLDDTDKTQLQEALVNKTDYNFQVSPQGLGDPPQTAPVVYPDVQSAIAAYNSGTPIIITPEIVAVYPAYANRLGKTIQKRGGGQ
jgi:hypothetical protein